MISLYTEETYKNAKQCEKVFYLAKNYIKYHILSPKYKQEIVVLLHVLADFEILWFCRLCSLR